MTAVAAWATPGNGPILLLGRDGLLGSALRQRLPAFCGPGSALIALGRGPASGSAPGLALDLADPAAILSVVREVRPRLIVNAAALTDVDRAEAEPALARAINATAPGLLAQAAAELGAALVHFSTDHVFGGGVGAPWCEDSPTDPPNAYGHSKLEGELAIRRSGCAHLILRTAWLHGPVPRGFVFTVLAQARQGRSLEVVDDQFGSPTAAAWLADASVHAIAAWQRLPDRGGLYHLTSAGATSRYGYARQVIESAVALGLVPPAQAAMLRGVGSASRPAPARRPADARLDCSRFAATFGLQPPPWQAGAAQTVADLAPALTAAVAGVEKRTHKP